MYNLEKIGKIIADLERYFAELGKLDVQGPTMSTERFYSLSMLLFAILNRAIDLGEEVIRGKKLGMPSSYRDIFQILEEEKVIAKPLSQELQYLAARRNVLAHEYFDVTEQSIYALSNKIKAVKELVKIVRSLVRSREKPTAKRTPK